MFCSGCGNPLKDGAKFCEFCGASVDGAGSAANSSSGTGAGGSPFDAEPSPFDALGGLNSNPNPWSATPSAGTSGVGDDVGSDFLWLNIASVLFCCCFPTTIVGLCYSVSARTAKGDGAWDKARMRATVAKTLFWVHLSLASILFVLFLFGKSLPPSETETNEPSAIERLEEGIEDAWRDAEIDASHKDAAEQDDSASVGDTE